MRKSRRSARKQTRLMEHFVAGTTARTAAALVRVNKTSAAYYFHRLRELIYRSLEQETPLAGEIEVDESYFGGKRKGKRGRGAYGKTAVFGVFKRNGCVFTEIVPDCSKATLQAIIRGRVTLDSVIYSDGWRGYDGWADVGFGKHLRVDHSQDEFARGRTHINGIEGFWGFAKSRLTRFRGMNKQTFCLHLKECEFRFNYWRQNRYPILLKLCRDYPLF